jgi:hypothetical protein
MSEATKSFTILQNISTLNRGLSSYYLECWKFPEALLVQTSLAQLAA